MQDKLAIIILGNQNAGKTTTLRCFCNEYYHKKISTFKKGWRFSMYPFHNKYKGVRINAFFLPASPTETKLSLAKSIKVLEWLPEFIFMAEQLNGNEYKNSIDTLRKENYHIKEFILNPVNESDIWHWYDKSKEVMIQQYRTEQIADYVRSFILSRI